MSTLQRSLAEACVVLGVNQDTELIHLTGGPELDSDGDYAQYGPFKQHVLGVFTESIAYFPEVQTKVEGEPFYEDFQVVCPNAVTSEDGQISVSPSVRRSISCNPEARRVLPFSSEVINSLPTFCFPSGGMIFKEKQKPEVNYLVMTNMEGLRTYAVSITFSRSYYVIKSSKESGKFILSDTCKAKDAFSSKHESFKVYGPLCICIVSLYPYINTLKDAVSSIIAEIDEDIIDIWRPIMKLATTLTSVPVPPPGPLAVEFTVFGGTHVLHPADETGRRVIDIDLHLPLLIFSAEDIVKIVTCILTQQRMVFISSSYPLLTLVIECFFAYIDPIKWRLTYVPNLPNSVGDLIEAPGPFIMGVHSSLRNQVKRVRKLPETPSIVLVDIDKNSVNLGENCPMPAMPDVVAQSLLVRLKNLCPHFDVNLVTTPTVTAYSDLKEKRKDFYDGLKAELKEIFLDMLLSLFGDVFNFMSVGECVFDTSDYLQTRHDDERSFFIEVLASDAFERFIDDRLENHDRRDTFAMLGERIATKRKTASRSRSSYVVENMKRNSVIKPIFVQKHEIYRVPLLLEENLATGNFYRVYCDSLSQKLDSLNKDNILLKASFQYLRGFAHLACNNPIEGLRDFYALYSSAPDLFPKTVAEETLGKLDEQSLDRLQHEPFYKQTVMFRHFTCRNNERKRSDIKRLPSEPLNKADFEKRIKSYKVVVNSDLIDELFELISENNNLVSPEQFSALYKVYTDIEKHSENREISGVKMKSNDRILQVSPLISSMYGMGRLVLSTNMLIFINEGAREFSKVTHLSDIKEIIKYQHSSVFWSGVQSLRIINCDRNIPPFYACLKDERDAWLLLLNEMSAAHKSAIELRDPKLVETGVNNILIARALLDMGYTVRSVEAVCLFVKQKAADISGLSEETKESLEMRLDPCVRESKRTTVMCLAFVPGNLAINDAASVWCGMGSGAIMIYETDKWNCVSEIRYAKNRVSCLHLVGENQIWAGSYDSVIYVINTDTRKSEQQFQNHTDFVSDIISCKDVSTRKTLVWSSSYNGQVICWDAETRQATKSLMLKKIRRLSQIIFVDDRMMWCVSTDRILIVDTASPDCPVLQKLIIYDKTDMPIMLEYALKVHRNEIWVSSKTDGGLYIWDTRSLKHQSIHLDKNIQICSMILSCGTVWIGNKDGKVILISPETKMVERTMQAHTDLVKSICETSEGHVITGSASKEGKICVWNASMGFEVIDGKLLRVNKKDYEKIKKTYEFVEAEEHDDAFPNIQQRFT